MLAKLELRISKGQLGQLTKGNRTLRGLTANRRAGAPRELAVQGGQPDQGGQLVKCFGPDFTTGPSEQYAVLLNSPKAVEQYGDSL